MRFIRFLGFFGFQKSCASELWTSQVVSGNRSPWILFWPAMVGLSKASRPSLTMAYLSITLAATCVVLSLAFWLQVGGLQVCWHLWGCVIFKVMCFFLQMNQPGCLGWKLVVWADQSKDVWRSLQRHRRLDSWMLFFICNWWKKTSYHISTLSKNWHRIIHETFHHHRVKKLSLLLGS